MDSFNDIAERFFKVDEKTKKLLIGNQEIPDVLRSVLKDEALYIQKSRLWEIIQATIVQEASTAALIKSENWEHVLIAKSLHRWGYIVKNLLHALVK